MGAIPVVGRVREWANNSGVATLLRTGGHRAVRRHQAPRSRRFLLRCRPEPAASPLLQLPPVISFYLSRTSPSLRPATF